MACSQNTGNNGMDRESCLLYTSTRSQGGQNILRFGVVFAVEFYFIVQLNDFHFTFGVHQFQLYHAVEACFQVACNQVSIICADGSSLVSRRDSSQRVQIEGAFVLQLDICSVVVSLLVGFFTDFISVIFDFRYFAGYFFSRDLNDNQAFVFGYGVGQYIPCLLYTSRCV